LNISLVFATVATRRYRQNGKPSGQLARLRFSRCIEPFDSDQYIFELKIDGFRALAHIAAGKSELISRNGNIFRGFADLATWIAEHLKLKAQYSMARSPVSMMLAAQSFVICFSVVVSACSSRLTCSTSTAKTYERCRSSTEKLSNHDIADGHCDLRLRRIFEALEAARTLNTPTWPRHATKCRAMWTQL